MSIRWLDNNNLVVGVTLTPDQHPAIVDPETGVDHGLYLTAVPEDVLAWHKERVAQKVLAYRGRAKTYAEVVLDTSTYVLLINAETLAMLQMRATANTPGMWADKDGEAFMVEAGEYQSMITQLITHGDWVYGRAEVYKMQVVASSDIDALNTIETSMDTEFTTYLESVE